MNDAPDWTTDEYLASMAVEELGESLARHGIGFILTAADDEHRVTVIFQGLADAEALMTLGVQGSELPGSLYDRATSGCVSMNDYANRGVEATEADIERLVDAGWNWLIHPAMNGRRMGWHVHLTLPSHDAATLVANLNALRLGDQS